MSTRLDAIIDFVLPGSPMADVGTDHAELPLRLLQSGAVPRAIGVDIGAQPLETARRRAGGWLDRGLELRQADGLEGLAPGEVATVVIAGMGGERIRRILGSSPTRTRSFARLVLCPNDHAPLLRATLGACGLGLVDEGLCEERRHWYPILVAEPRPTPAALDAADLRLGPILRRRRPPTWSRWVEAEQARVAKALRAAQAGARDPAVLRRLQAELELLHEASAPRPPIG